MSVVDCLNLFQRAVCIKFNYFSQKIRLAISFKLFLFMSNLFSCEKKKKKKKKKKKNSAAQS